MMFFNTMFALYFSLVFLSAMLISVGPNGHTCDVYAWPGLLFGLVTCKKKEKMINMTEDDAAEAVNVISIFKKTNHNSDTIKENSEENSDNDTIKENSEEEDDESYSMI